jgi:hypothetical protein
MGQIGYGLAQMDASRLDAVLKSIPEGKERNNVVQAYVNQQAYNDPAAAARMVQKLELREQSKMLKSSSLLHYLGQSDPELAVKLAAQAGLKDSYMSNALGQMAAKDFAKAEQLLAGLDPAQQQKALPQLCTSLASQDGPAAIAKLSSITNNDVSS